ncbi:MAG: CHAT domain-containing protein [Pseudomonadota bacterium]
MDWRPLLFALLWLPLAAGAAPAHARTAEEILATLDRYPVNAGKNEEARRLLAAPLPDGAAPEELVVLRVRRARAAQQLGLVQTRIDELRAAIALGGGRNPSRVWKELSTAEYNGGDFRQAIAARLKAIELTPRNRSGQLPSDYAMLADAYRRIGEFERARQAVRDAEGVLFMLRRGKNWDERHFGWEAEVEDALGRVELGAGHYAEAEARFRRAIDFKEKDNARHADKEEPNELGASQDQMESRLDGMLVWLAKALAAQGRLDEAEVNARKAVLNSIGRGGQDGVQVGKMLLTLAQVLAQQGRFAEALAVVDRVNDNFGRAGVVPESLLFAHARRQRAGILTGLKRWPEALAEYEAAVTGVGADAQLAASFAIPSIGWIRALMATGRRDEALAKARLLHEKFTQRYGAAAYETAEARAYEGAILVVLNRDGEAIPPLREALATMIPAVAQEGDRAGLRFARLEFIVTSYLKALARVRGTPLEKTLGIDAAAEAFVAADVLRGQAVQQAMLASAARAAAGTPELADLVRREQDSRQERDALYAILADLLSRPADQGLPQTVASMRQRAAALDQEARTAMRTIRERFPDYADLIAPRPATLAAVQAALRPGEALLSILTAGDQSLVWAIPAQGVPAFAAVPLGRQETEALVGRLRAALDPGDVDLARLPRFDPEAAHRLYRELLAPVAVGWRGARHLFVAAGGALARLPFAVLLTAPPPADPPAGTGPAFRFYRDWPWLIRDLGISQLPSSSALLTLRRMAKGGAARAAFIGFGDPDFGGAAMTAAGTRRLRATATAAATRGADGYDYASIPPLPDTRAEILSLARALRADPERDVYLGKSASRETVLKTDLSRRRIVAFATHGLLAGEYPGVDQPALALANPGGGGHGLLTLDDILTLKLDADWVVLSACNTAAGDGRGGEAISGLGRGFFYSGSRALLVTHWPVETVSAQKLVVGVFEALGADPALNRAEALRRSMLKLMGADASDGDFRFAYAHPMFWAPYALVGDGGH